MLGFRDLGIDLGTASVLVYVKGKGIVLKEPSVISIDKNKRNFVLARPDPCWAELPATSWPRPLSGVISDYEITEKCSNTS